MPTLHTRPYRDLTPGWIATADFTPPYMPLTSQRERPWRNNNLVTVLQAQPWLTFQGPVAIAAALPGSTTYRLPAQDAYGSWKLTPIPEKNQTGPAFDAFYATYQGLSQVICLQDLKPFFPLGVPYLETVTLPDSGMQDMVRGIKPAVPYPVELPSDQILILGAMVGKPGELLTVHYQELTAFLRPNPASDEERLAMIAGILSGAQSPADKLKLIGHVLLTGKVEAGLT